MPPRRPTRRSKHMLLLGYALSVQDFVELIRTVPDLSSHLQENPGTGLALDGYIFAYKYWKRTLYKRGPELDIYYDHVNDADTPGPTSFFFVTRWGRYTTREKLLENIPKAIESDSDRTKLATWVQEAERLGASLDPAKLKFKCIEPSPILRQKYDFLPMTRS